MGLAEMAIERLGNTHELVKKYISPLYNSSKILRNTINIMLNYS